MSTKVCKSLYPQLKTAIDSVLINCEQYFHTIGSKEVSKKPDIVFAKYLKELIGDAVKLIPKLKEEFQRELNKYEKWEKLFLAFEKKYGTAEGKVIESPELFQKFSVELLSILTQAKSIHLKDPKLHYKLLFFNFIRTFNSYRQKKSLNLFEKDEFHKAAIKIEKCKETRKLLKGHSLYKILAKKFQKKNGGDNR